MDERTFPPAYAKPAIPDLPKFFCQLIRAKTQREGASMCDMRRKYKVATAVSAESVAVIEAWLDLSYR